MATFQFRRRWVSIALMFALVFAQCSVGAHACPRDVSAHSPAAAIAAPTDDGGLLGVEAEPIQPCMAHCESGHQAVGAATAGDAPAAMVLIAVLDWSPAVMAPAHAARLQPMPAAGAPPPGSPPIYLSLLVLRN